MSLSKFGPVFLALTLLWSGHARAVMGRGPVLPVNKPDLYANAQEGETVMWVLESDGREIVVEEVLVDGVWVRNLHVMKEKGGAEGSNSQPVLDFSEIPDSDVVKIEESDDPNVWSTFLHDSLAIPEGVGIGLGSLSFETERLKIKAGFKLPPREERPVDSKWIEVVGAEVGFSIKL
ncbi:MAG: hypothetical protein ABIR96_05795 [Bdellovibrionota bacterium]